MFDHVIQTPDDNYKATKNGVISIIPADPGNIDYVALMEWAAEGNVIEPYVAPAAEPVVTVLSSVTLWERLTEVEADQVNEEMQKQSFRTRKIFETAATFRSDHELWPLLEQIANQLFGAERAAELLAP